MAHQLPVGVWLSGEDACRIDGLLRIAISDAGRRNGHVPAKAVEVSEVIHRAAIEFRESTRTGNETALVSANSGTSKDSSASVSALSFPSDTERLTAQQAARMTGTSRELICRLAAKGVLNGTRTGQRGGWLLDPDSVALWAAGRRRNAA